MLYIKHYNTDNKNKQQLECMAKIGQIMRSGRFNQFAKDAIGSYSGESKIQGFVLQLQSLTMFNYW